MAVLKHVKDASRRWVIRQMTKPLPRLTMDNMETMINLGEKLLNIVGQQVSARTLEELANELRKIEPPTWQEQAGSVYVVFHPPAFQEDQVGSK